MTGRPGTDGTGAAAGERLVREIGTARVRTAVLVTEPAPGTRDGSGFVWARSPGSALGRPLPRPPEAIAALVRAASDGAPARLALPEPGPAGGVLRYAVPGPFAVIRLLHDPGAATRRSVRAALHALGATLRALHAVPAPDGLPTVPPGPARLDAWLATGGAGPGAAPLLYGAARSRLGAGRLRLVREWAAAAAGPGPRVLLHGGPALGNLVHTPGRGRPALLTGEELASGCWEFDVAWLLAECAELAAGPRHGIGGAPPADYAALGAAFVEGYGKRPGAAASRRALALRALTHAHDFAAYVGWHERDLHGYLAMTADAVDAARA